jgi:Slime mold cyclic AMP receptor
MTEPALELPFVLFGWGLPVLLTIIAKVTDSLDTTPHPFRWECWMENVRGYGQWLFFYAEMGIACLVGMCLWPRIAERIWITHKQEGSPVLMLSYMRHVLFIIIFFFVFACMMIYRVVDVIQGAGYTLTMLHTVCVTTTGIYCFVVFGLSTHNLQLWWRLLCCKVSSIDSL